VLAPRSLKYADLLVLLSVETVAPPPLPEPPGDPVGGAVGGVPVGADPVGGAPAGTVVVPDDPAEVVLVFDALESELSAKVDTVNTDIIMQNDNADEIDLISFLFFSILFLLSINR